MNYIIYSPELLIINIILIILFKNIYIIKYFLIIFLIFLLYFFRGYDKKLLKNIPLKYILSPAQGTIKNIYYNDNNIIITIYLNIFDKHVQIIPYSGIVIKQKYKPGEFNTAYILNKSDYNERMITTIKSNFGNYTVIQYAGMITKRILTFIKKNEQVFKGEPLGLIKFSSRVDIILPKNFIILNNINDKINLGQPIAIIKN